MADKGENNTDNSLLNSGGILYRIASFQYHETLANIMERDVYVCTPGDQVQSVAQEMSRRRISSAVVVNQDRVPVGIVTERDMLRKVVAECTQEGVQGTIADIMTSNPLCLQSSDTLFDALSALSRHKIKHLPIVDADRLAGIISLRQIMKIRHAEPFVIIGQLEQARSPEDFLEIRQQMIQLVREKLEANSDPVDLVAMLSLINAGIHKQLLRIAIEEAGPPPVQFSCFLTGSHGRKENLLFPDQDFCVIMNDFDDGFYNEYDGYFLRLSLKFSELLAAAGFATCSGNIMGQNPTWRKRISEWLVHVSHIMRHQGRFTVRYVTLIFDSAHLFGNRGLFDRYMDHAYQEISRNHNVLRQMHEEEEGVHEVPLGLFNTFKTEKTKGHRGEIDMKKSGLIFFIESARILALKHGVRETSTLGRIRELVSKGVIHRDDSEFLENSYRVILYHTLGAQTENYLTGGRTDYYLRPRDLSARNQEMLKQAFRALSSLQETVRSEFGELVI